MNPRSPEALNGLAGLLTKEQQYPQAAGVYEQLIKIQPAIWTAGADFFLHLRAIIRTRRLWPRQSNIRRA